MFKFINKGIEFAFYLLFIAVPLILFPKTSEIFEFNKMVTVYFFTVVISSLWFTKMILKGKIIFTKTLLDIPLLVFLLSQAASTVFSIDPRTSVFGYYSRFNGGFLSSLSYALLYWSYVSNMDAKKTKRSLFVIFGATLISSIWAIFEHYGHSFSCLIFPDFRTFDVSCWVQDVRTRVYSSFGQPNWLAAWLVAVIPLTWAYSIQNSELHKVNKIRINKKFVIYFSLVAVFFTALLFTKSRSGLLAFAVGSSVYWSAVFIKAFKEKKLSGFFNSFLLFNLPFLILTGIFGSPWTPGISTILSKTNVQESAGPQGPALETGGTESGKIRQIVWKGAGEIWKHYPVFGSGVETFAYSYYQYRPVEHNYVSEWDYLYNKAHNEYLNFAATTGTLGLLSYFVMIAGAIGVILNEKRLINNILIFLIPVAGILVWFLKRADKPHPKDNLIMLRVAFFSGFISIAVTNLFGFSVVPVSLLFFLIPAMAVASEKTGEGEVENPAVLNNTHKGMIIILLSFSLLFIFGIGNYWYSDYLYAKGRYENDAGLYQDAFKTLSGLVSKSSKEPIYWNELADSSTYLALNLKENKNSSDLAKTLADSAVSESKEAISLSPANVNLKRSFATRLENLSGIDPSYILASVNILKEAQSQAPTDVKLKYQLSVNYLRTGDYKDAISEMEQAVSLKSDYEKARYALALMYFDTEDFKKEKEQLEFILEKINPSNAEAKKELDEVNSKLP